MSDFSQQNLRIQEGLCHQDQPPLCTAICPLHVDARGLSVAVANEDFAKGRELLEKAVNFPRILSQVCEAPCEQQCKRKECGGGIHIRQLEVACLQYGSVNKNKRLFLPKKQQRIAILGGDLSGLNAAVELARKGYKVTIYEQGEQIGDSIFHHASEIVDLDSVEQDLAILSKLSIMVKTEQALDSVQLDDCIEQYDGVYIANSITQQKEIADFITQEDEFTFQSNREKVLISNNDSVERRYIQDMGDGKFAAISLDRLLQKVSLVSGREYERSFISSLFTSLDGVADAEPIEPKDGVKYTFGEAIEESKRCIDCQCLECVKACPYLAHYKGYPKSYIREIYNNLSIAMGNHTANGMINACALCGQCKRVCPNGFDLGEVCQQARNTMVKTKKMPPSTHEFALLDLAFSNSEEFFLVRHQPGWEQSTYAFFPGCQMGASMPKLVDRVYQELIQGLDGGVGLVLGCCGVIAQWAGKQELVEQELEKIYVAWEQLGKPIFITSCPNCQKILTERTEIPVVHIVELLNQDIVQGLDCKQGLMAIHDPCGARNNVRLQDQIRQWVSALGYRIEELPYHRQQSSCCGYGGLMSIANKEVANKMTEQLLEYSRAPYITYCINCRDRLKKKNKEVYHILELIYPAVDDVAPNLSQRRENRILLNQRMRENLWKEAVMAMSSDIQLSITPDVQAILEDRMILTSDIIETLEHAREQGNVLFDQRTGLYSTSYRKGNVTFWIVYRQVDQVYEIYNGYSHRMTLEEV